MDLHKDDGVYQVLNLMKKQYGVDLFSFSSSFLHETIEKQMAASAVGSGIDFVTYLASDSRRAEEFHRSLIITYSEFFRNPLTFDLLAAIVLPRLIDNARISKRNEIRVWTAGCAAGQESYSIAILFDELQQDQGSGIRYRIFATDISSEDLDHAKKGIYPKEALQNVKMKHVHSCFKQTGDEFCITERIKNQIEYSYYDLLDTGSVSPPASIYGDFDLITCCNLLFYYNQESQQMILNKFSRSLARGGYLVTGETEAQSVTNLRNFSELFIPVPVFMKVAARYET